MTSVRPAPDYSLYLVTDTGMCGERGVPKTVAAAVRAGVTMVQLRDPGAGDRELVALGRAVRDVLAGTGVPLLVNDRVDLVGEIGADGAHIGQGDMSVPRARALLGETRLLGLSVHDVGQVEAAREHGEALDYLGVGPVWATSTKPGHAPPGGPGRLRDVVAASPWPCVAIGGIDAGRIAEVRATGVAGAAVVSAICAADEPAAATRELRDRWDAAREGAS